MGDDLAPYFNKLYQTRGLSSMLNRELLNWPEDVIRIADLQGSTLWPFKAPQVATDITVTLNLLGAKSYMLRIPRPLGLMFAEREPKGIETPRR